MPGYPATNTIPQLKRNTIRILGTGAAAPTLVEGENVTVTRTGLGVYRFTFTVNPYQWLGPAGAAARQCTTVAALKGCTETWGAFVAATDSAGAYVEMSLWDSAFNIRELAALEWLTFDLLFQTTSV